MSHINMTFYGYNSTNEDGFLVTPLSLFFSYHSQDGLPLNRLGVYLPGKLRADNRLALPSTTAKAMYLVIFMSVASLN
jgi:hypothetical protein